MFSVQTEARITKNSESSTKWELSKCKEDKEDIIVGCFVRRYSARWALSRCADRHRRKELSEF
jgi:hypothetical protein